MNEVGAGVFGSVLNFLIFISSQLIIFGSDYWVSIWASKEEKHSHLKFKSFQNSSLNNFTQINENRTDALKLETQNGNILIENRFFYYKVYLGKNKLCEFTN